CLESIRFLTDEPYELIVVDNGSTDGTVEYLRSCSDVRLIENAENRGFPAAVNQGIEVSRGEQILLLNNDVVVTTGWLRHQLAALRSDQQVGLVGPCSNCVAGFQQVPVRYEDLACLDGFAWEWGKEHRGNIIEVDRLMGFCLLIRREVIERIGLFDERFGIGNFEDDDFCRRARQDGFRAGIAQAAFIHHFGHASFRGSGADLGAILKRNEQLYREKWGDAGHAEKPCGAESANAGLKPKFSVRIADDGLLLVPATIRLSLCMICRDNAGTIGACLESIRPWVDELIVVDTGSKDDSPEICRRLGAEVHDFAWPDCFSTARNESLKYARGEWIFWMDSDDTISPECGRKLRELAYGPHDHAVLGYVVQVHCPGGGPDGEADMTVVDHVKLFRNRPDLRFDGRIHEQIIPAIRRAGGEVGWTDLYVTHSGADHTPEGRKRKLERDMRLLELDLADRPDHPFVLFNLGMTFADAGHHEQAVSALKRSIEVADPSESQVRKAYALLLGSLCQLERLDEALECCQRGRDLFPKDPELLFREGILAHKVGDLARAERAYLAALNGGDERHFTSIDRGIVGFKARHNLAAVYMDRGESAAAEEQWRQAIGEMPSFREAWHCLADLLLRQRRHAELRDLIAQIEQYPSLRAIGTLVQAQFERAQGNIAGVRAMLSSALRQYPAEIELQRFRCQFLFEHGDPSEAEEALHELLQLDPTDASVHHNLGTTYLRTARFDAAVCSLRESLRLRPKSSPTLVNLGYGLDQLGRTDDAIAAWKQALDYDPEYLPAREALLSKGAS
ncbi:MAG: glycosyltransferase, partial [Planctomycetes bacterium]|nr:glycosyltransferase [Planctomycetota bacterium]